MVTPLVVLVVLAALLSPAVPAPAAEEKRISPQAQRMKDCNVQARERSLSGGARKQFMSDCLKGGGSVRASDGAASPGEAGVQGEPSPQGKQ